MRNPLIKRLPRELKGEIGKYIVLFLFITMMIGIVSGFLVAAGSMATAYDESFEKYNIEQGNFELLQKADDETIKKIEDGKEKVKVYENFYIERETKEVDSTVRIFKNRKDIDKICIMEGELPTTDDEIAIDRMYAVNNDYKVGDNITTDHIMPAGAKILPLRSNIPAISQHCFTVCDEDFPRRAKNMGKSIIVGGSNYGQGSSREHAALAPLYLGIKAVLVKSFARIHRANLINAGILPLTFVNEADYDKINQGDEIVLADVRADVEADMTKLTVVNKTTGVEIPVLCELTGRTKDIILAGGLLDYTREQLSK